MEFLHFFFFKSHFCLARSGSGRIHSPISNLQPCQPNTQGKYALIKENQIFLINKEIQSLAVAESYMRKGFLIYEEMRKYFHIYEEAVSQSSMTLQLLHSEFPY